MGLYSDGDGERRVAVEEATEEYRSCWRRDYARVIHSPAFRRLQGKTQLFPAFESDFFRNRLTHSLEAAQIAKSIAIRLNATESFLGGDNGIEPEITEIAALCHDLGHPPFGHNGERALDACMKDFGGFEGNAQTLRIIARLEKRENESGSPTGIDDDGIDRRCGMNLTARVVASILKYDHRIPKKRSKSAPLSKGYYESELELVTWFKKKTSGSVVHKGGFKTVECQIMDIADDIAYSTYDLEDAFKAKFLIPLDLTAAAGEVVEQVASEVAKALRRKFAPSDVRQVANDVFQRSFLEGIGKSLDDMQKINAGYRASLNVANDGYLRTKFTSRLVAEYIRGVVFTPDPANPSLSKVELRPEIREEVEVLKNFSYVSLIMSPRLKVAEFRGGEIIEEIFRRLAAKDGHRLLPDDFQASFLRSPSSQGKRVICDFIAGMTDRYALEFYGRLKSESPQTIFKPL